MQILYKVLRLISVICHFTVHWPLALYYRKGKAVPPVKNTLLLKSATQLAKDIREGKLQSVEVVQAYIDRIEEVDPCINATVDRHFQDALREANEVDLLVASRQYSVEQLREEKPLLGVPFSVKVLLLVKGLRCTGGCKLFEDLVATEDAPSVALMKKAGAIVIATTNAPEMAMNLETANLVHGRTGNPYNTNRTPGGSSGGESALIASGGSATGLGNDLLGSLRIPAHFTGTFAHKPTRGLVPNEGSFPPDRLFEDKFTKPGILKYMCTGPICRYAEDLVTSMKVLTTDREVKMKIGKKVNFQNLKLCYLKEIQSYLNVPVDQEISRALLEAVSYFEREYGIKAKEVKMPWFMDGFRCLLNELLNSIPDLADTLTGGKGVDFNLNVDFLKSIFGKSKLSFTTLVVFKLAYFPLLYKKVEILYINRN